MTDKKETPTGLALLMVPFDPHEVGKLPKPTKAQTDEVKANFKAGVRCDLCGAWHHPKVVHLDYVGHAALTKRLLQVDPRWSWEPMALTPQGAPLIDQHGGLWIRLTVCGMTRIGYGHADGKTGGDAIKEAVGDSLRNAALRFGAALDLWHKGALYDAAELMDMGAGTPTPPIRDLKNGGGGNVKISNIVTSTPPPPPIPDPRPPLVRGSATLPPKPPAAGITAEAYAANVKSGIAAAVTEAQLNQYLAAQKAGLDRLATANMTLRDEVEQAAIYKRLELDPFKEGQP